MNFDPARTALLLIDNQKGFEHPTHWGTSRSNPKFESNLEALIKGFRSKKNASKIGPLIIHVYHESTNPQSPLHPSSSGMAFLDIAKPLNDEPTISKTVNSAFIGTKLEELLRQHEISQLYLAGLTTDHCVSTTTRMAANLHVTDFVDAAGKLNKGSVILVEDATAAWAKGDFDAETIHRVHVESLRGEFALITTSKDAVERMRNPLI